MKVSTPSWVSAPLGMANTKPPMADENWNFFAVRGSLNPTENGGELPKFNEDQSKLAF
ncbi:hypothetical protein [Anaerotignum sp. MB30-C6]|uniref:hypothetical protein n=1 Tax=Anaerotignum sp. MB30-C6 TaxID=3070814 RepID=UPI0027DCBE93|nr:hypothetical protein [Anaerotignum sp. MB30-C6]WMI81310.1 hypothetical protein RBQ60_00845 [Anaerotignum sp. MB30-C6]